MLATGADHEFVDHALAARLHERLEKVLDRWASLTADERELVADTIAYVVDSDDEEHDLRSPIGLVDDAEQVENLLRAVAPDLLD